MATQGLRWHYDVTGAEPIIRDMRIYSASTDMPYGTAMCYGAVATAEHGGVAKAVVGNELTNVIGVLQETISAANALSVVATGVDKYGKVCINPFAVWLGIYSTHADDDVPTTAADSTGKALTITQVTGHLRSWTYITDTVSTGTGIGNLFQVGAITGTTVLTSETTYDTDLVAVGSGDSVIVMPAPFSADVAGGSVDLSDATGQVGMQIAGYNATAAAGKAVILENYIQSTRRSIEPLRCSKHSGKNYKAEDPDFFGDVIFSDHLLSGTGASRVIT